MTRTIRPWRALPLDDVYKEMDSLVQHFFGEEKVDGVTDFVPRINVAESDSGFKVTADLPGINPDDVHVEVHDNQLLISGERSPETTEKGEKLHRVERHTGKFRRVVTLPDTLERDKITADYEHGVLVVTLPKSEKLKPTRIPVGTKPTAAG